MAEVLWRLVEKSSGTPNKWASAIGEHTEDLTAHALMCALDNRVRRDSRHKNGHFAQYAIRDSSDGEVKILEKQGVCSAFGGHEATKEHTKAGRNYERILASM